MLRPYADLDLCPALSRPAELRSGMSTDHAAGEAVPRVLHDGRHELDLRTADEGRDIARRRALA